MLTKGYHFFAQCDTAGCSTCMVVGTKNLSYEEKKAARQELKRHNWGLNTDGMLTCPQCNAMSHAKYEEVRDENPNCGS